MTEKGLIDRDLDELRIILEDVELNRSKIARNKYDLLKFEAQVERLQAHTPLFEKFKESIRILHHLIVTQSHVLNKNLEIDKEMIDFDKREINLLTNKAKLMEENILNSDQKKKHLEHIKKFLLIKRRRGEAQKIHDMQHNLNKKIPESDPNYERLMKKKRIDAQTFIDKTDSAFKELLRSDKELQHKIMKDITIAKMKKKMDQVNLKHLEELRLNITEQLKLSQQIWDVLGSAVESISADNKRLISMRMKELRKYINSQQPFEVNFGTLTNNVRSEKIIYQELEHDLLFEKHLTIKFERIFLDIMKRELKHAINKKEVEKVEADQKETMNIMRQIQEEEDAKSRK
ncbi:hypothetical protein ACFL1H_06055 [Nanoarchaeota archaeon]